MGSTGKRGKFATKREYIAGGVSVCSGPGLTVSSGPIAMR